MDGGVEEGEGKEEGGKPGAEEEEVEVVTGMGVVTATGNGDPVKFIKLGGVGKEEGEGKEAGKAAGVADADEGKVDVKEGKEGAPASLDFALLDASESDS